MNVKKCDQNHFDHFFSNLLIANSSIQAYANKTTAIHNKSFVITIKIKLILKKRGMNPKRFEEAEISNPDNLNKV